MTELQLERVKSGAWCIHGLLDKLECEKIIRGALEMGAEETVAQGDRRHRNHNGVKFSDPELAGRMWDRLKEVAPKEYRFSSDSPPPDGFQEESAREMIGLWRPSGVKADFTILYYKSGGHFGPHRDSYQIISEHERSILSLATYLTDRPAGHGGATHFLVDEMNVPLPDETGRIRAPVDCIEAKVEADEAGKAIMFQHDLMHEGETIQVSAADHSTSPAPKWLLLTQVLYVRDPETAPLRTPDQIEARRILVLAERAEVEGNIPEAIRLYNQAYRLDRELETL